MSFSFTVGAVALAVQARIPVLLIGNPGDAKTRIVESILRRVCADFHTSIVALHEPPEYGGYPVPKEDGVRLLPCAWVNRLAEVKDETQIVGLFLDELSNGPPATRSAAMRGVLDGTWGERTIPRLATVAAMNPAEIAESGYELSAPLANRFCHIQWDMPADYWLEAFIAGFPEPSFPKLPANWRDRMPWARTLVASFGRKKQSTLKALPNEAKKRAEAWPSFRTWTMACDALAATRAAGFSLEHEVTTLLISGCVGTGAALEFLAFAKELDLPDPEDVLKNPKQLKLPERGDRAFAVLTSVVAAVIAKNSAERWVAGWDVLAVAANQGRADVGAVAARTLANNKPADYKTNKAPPGVQAYVPVLQQAGLLKSDR